MAKYGWVKKIDLSQFAPRERLLMAGTAIAVAVFLLVYIYLPSHRQVVVLAQEHEQIRKEVFELEQQLDEARKNSERMRTFKRTESGKPGDAGNLVARIQGLGSYRQSLSVILEELNRLAKTASVDFLSVRPGSVEEEGGLQAQSMAIDARSTFKGLGGYLDLLENLPRLIHVQNLRIEADPSEATHVLAHLTMTIYLEKD